MKKEQNNYQIEMENLKYSNSFIKNEERQSYVNLTTFDDFAESYIQTANSCRRISIVSDEGSQQGNKHSILNLNDLCLFRYDESNCPEVMTSVKNDSNRVDESNNESLMISIGSDKDGFMYSIFPALMLDNSD